MACSSALKLTAACMLLLCVVGSDLARPALASSSLPPSPGELLLRELVEHDLAEELGLLEQQQSGGDVTDICPSACQTCLVMCAVTCVLSKVPIACLANCTVSNSCFGKTVTSLGKVTA